MTLLKSACMALSLLVAGSLLGVVAWAGSPDHSNTTAREKKPGKQLKLQNESFLGTWVRSVTPCDGVMLTIEPDRLCCTVTMTEDGDTLTMDFRAEYSISKDGILYGLITNAVAKGSKEMKVETLMKIERSFIESPISIRFRVDGDTLTIKDSRWPLREQESSFLDGRYDRQTLGTADQNKPSQKASKPQK